MEWANCVTPMQERNVHRVLVGKHKINMLLCRPKCSCEGNVKTDLNEQSLYIGFTSLTLGISGGGL